MKAIAEIAVKDKILEFFMVIRRHFLSLINLSKKSNRVYRIPILNLALCGIH